MNGSLGIPRGPEQHPQRFADYFVICGLDKDSGLEPDKYFGDSLQCTPLDRAYKSKVLGHYPDSVPWNPFDEHAVCMLCLPSGLRFRTQKHSVEPTFHSFVLTKEDGHRTYGFSLVFYEECRNRKICAAMQTLQAMHITELSSGQNGTPPTARKGQEGHNTRSLPRHFKLSAHSPSAALAYYDSTKDKLLVTKSISLLCQQPYLHAARTFLTNLYKCVPRHPGPGLSLESYVYNLLYNVPVPLPGKSLKFFIPNDEPAKVPLELVIHQPMPSQELPMLDYPLKDVFTWLGADCVIQLFTCVLLENQVLLRSSDFNKLMVVSECITALLFPFSWQHVYVPILPASLHHFLDAPVPFIMGLHAQSEGGVLKIASEANLCYVDIDKQSSQFPEELPVFPHKMQFIAEIRALLNKYKVPQTGKTDNMFINYVNGDIMTSSLTLPGSGFHLPRRKHSLHDVLDWDRPDSTPQTDAFQRIVDIVKRTGVNVDDIDSVDDTINEKILTPQEEYQETLIFNNAIREIFLNRFVQMFCSYEHFVILPSQDKDEWLNNRDSMHVFDKATFLSDQPAQHLPFLSRFLETQMFASLVDSKVMSTWSELDYNIKVFDDRITFLKKKVGETIIRSTRYETCTSMTETQKVLEQRLTNVDFETNPPTEIVPHRAAYFRSFPLLDTVALNKEPAQSSRKGQTQWKYKMKSMESNGKTAVPQESQSPRPQTKLSADMSPALIAQANWTFVEKLLKDCKSKTKRMLVEKMGSEAVALGHASESLSDVEENTLVASLCDLLERIWSHGLQNKQGKSALWSHLTMYQELEECNVTTKTIDPNFLSPDLSKLALETDVSPTRGTDKHKSPGERRAIGPEHLRPLPESLTFDIRNIQAMTDIKTHIGYARAWVRLALEKKLLSRHLKTLLSDTALLRSQYKRSAFLRCEEEKEQFLYHLLTLNAVDYFCFTNNYPTTKLPYRVVIFPSRKASAATTSANSWIAISGTLCETNPVPIPKAALEFVFHHKNLGVLSTLRIGHDNTGLSPKWMVEHVVVRNEVTGHTFKFPCGRWLGKGIDDGSTERLLVGALVPSSIDNEELVESCSTPPRCRSPSIPRRPILSEVELQHMLGEAVNAIVKYYYRRECQDSSLTALLCGEGGLVPSLEQIFLFGFKNQRIFGRNFYVWDYLLRVKENFEISLLEEMDEYSQRLNRSRKIQSNQRFTILRCYSHLIDQINIFSQTLGKDGKVFDCHNYMSETTVEILLETAMGVSKSTQGQSGFEYAMAVMKMCDILHLRHTKVWLRPDWLFNLTKYSKDQIKLLEIIHGLTKKVIQRKKEEYKSGKRNIIDITGSKTFEKVTTVEGLSFGQSAGLKDDLDVDDNDVGEKKRQAFLDLLIEAGESGVILNEQEVKEQVDTIMFEGHDTTASGSSFFLTMMGCHPDIQEKVIQELDEIFGDSDRPATFQDTLQMKYLERCLMETLRMYPPVPIIARDVKTDIKLVSDNYTIPRGCTVIIGTIKTHRLESIYPNPNVFDPDNFLPERTANRHYYAFIPFSAGPRSCVGRKYAMLKLKILLSTILRNFRVKSEVKEDDFRLQADIILKRAEGFPVRLEPRKRVSVQA